MPCVQTLVGGVKSWLLRLGAGGLTLICLMSPGGAATINIDFGPLNNIYKGVGAAPDPGTVWNGVDPSGSIAPLF